jgi:hypothetical protein
MLTIMTACRSLQMKCTAYTVVSKKFWSITYYIHGVADFVMVVIFVIVRLWLRGYRSLKKGVLKNVSEGARRQTYDKTSNGPHTCVFVPGLRYPFLL